MSIQFSVKKTSKKSQGRLGSITTRHGDIATPAFMPIATRGAVKTLSSDDLAQLSPDVILANTYHLWLQPGHERVKQAGGLHRFMRWPKPILTDSGGYQVFSLAQHRKLTEQGVHFQEPKSGARHLLTPELAVDIQLALGVDVLMALDECPPYPCTQKYAKESLALTSRWAERCRKHWLQQPAAARRGRGLLGIVQGSVYQKLRQQSAKEITALDFDGYAIGGVAVGEPRSMLEKILSWTVPLLPATKPRYLMGLGRPEELVEAVRAGIDLFDCVIPTREGRHGRLFIRTRTRLTGQFYTAVNITNQKFQDDHTPINAQSAMPMLRQYTRAYLHHLFKIEESLAWRLATLHNLEFYLTLMKDLRRGIRQGKV